MGIPDVDLDVANREEISKLFPKAIKASQLSSDKKKLVAHNTGLYFQHIPVDPISEMSSFPYGEAEELGYYKVDFIPFHIYEGVQNENELIELIKFVESDDFPWYWFQETRFFENENNKFRITHLGGYKDLCKQYPPTSVEDVAILIALIRPRKKYLIGEDWNTIKEMIWQKIPEEETTSTGSYFFKKSHAIGYALAVLVHMVILDEELS